jgi:hypothetical protein
MMADGRLGTFWAGLIMGWLLAHVVDVEVLQTIIQNKLPNSISEAHCRNTFYDEDGLEPTVYRKQRCSC